jgi:2-polyprenyl-6-methoxyphenol hydroxylase-like FAD-dependent oxidoreductase
MPALRIAIVGGTLITSFDDHDHNSDNLTFLSGGPGGLMLACLLQHNNIPCSIFEQEKSRLARSQGGTLDIHRDSGQEALAQAGLMDEFRCHMRLEGTAMRFMDAQGQVLADHDGEDEPEEASRPEIDRAVLRDMLLDSLKPSTIQWGRTLLRAEPVEENKLDLHFSDGGVERAYDIVVGADGAWSKIRPLLTDANPSYSGIMCVEAHIKNAGERYPELAKRVGNGSCFQFGYKKALIAQRNGDGSIRTYAMLRVPEDWEQTCGTDWTQGLSAREEFVAKEFGSWDQKGKELILQSDAGLVLRPLYQLPVGTNWTSRVG